MTRLVLAILLAISMAMSSGPAFAGPSPDCAMARSSPGMADHQKMGCCTNDCAVACVPAVLGADPVDLPSVEPSVAPAVVSLAPVLTSVGRAITDPPPRTAHS